MKDLPAQVRASVNGYKDDAVRSLIPECHIAGKPSDMPCGTDLLTASHWLDFFNISRMIAYMLFLMNPSSFATAFNGGTGFFRTVGITRNTTTHTAERGT